MVTADEVRALALAQPGAEELPHFDRASFRVGGRIFATIAPDQKSGMLQLELDQHEALLRANPAAFFSFGGWSRSGATGVLFARVPKRLFAELLEQAWQKVLAKLPASRRPGSTARAKPSARASGSRPRPRRRSAGPRAPKR